MRSGNRRRCRSNSKSRRRPRTRTPAATFRGRRSPLSPHLLPRTAAARTTCSRPLCRLMRTLRAPPSRRTRRRLHRSRLHTAPHPLMIPVNTPAHGALHTNVAYPAAVAHHTDHDEDDDDDDDERPPSCTPTETLDDHLAPPPSAFYSRASPAASRAHRGGGS